jgi:Ras-related protein Rab-21
MDEPIPVKVVLVGDTGVGKTCIIQRYVNNSYSEENESTLSSTYTNKVLEFKEYNKKLSLDIWDTAGQELYRALAKNFYLNAAIGILVYDIRRRESYDSIKNYWVDQMRESGEENMILGIAGNKCDLFQEEEVPDDEVKKFAQSIGAIFKPTSCKECIGIDELFQECGKKFLENNNLLKINNKEKANDKPIKLENKKEDKNNNNNKRKCC